LKGAPVDLVKCETSDLMVPAETEIVLEGAIHLEERTAEGPFAEWMGYYEEAEPAPVFEVSCITHRRNPIYQMTTVAHGNSEGNFLFMFGAQYQFYNLIKENATWIEDVFLPLEGRLFAAIVSVKKHYPYLGRQTLYKIFSTPPSANYLNYCVVVDDDINIYDAREVMWAISTKVDAERDVVVMPPIAVTGFNPAARARVEVGGKLGVAICSKLGIDATSKTPAEGHQRGFVERVQMPAAVLGEVRRRWAEYGFKS
jgi:4-hydroxy-3-polyprenylbenzoate decarboxylase